VVPSGKGAGQRLKLRDWQVEIIIGIYGATDAEGLRLCRQAVISMARKNGKTALVAGLVLCHLFGPEAEMNGEVYCAAANKEQAGNLFKYCNQIIERTPEIQDLVLSGQLKVLESKMRIVFHPLGTFYQTLSKSPDTKHGFNPTVVVMDELAQWKNPELYDVLTSGFGAREEPLTLVISTQAPNDQHILSELIDYGLRCESGEVDDPSMRCWLFTVPEKIDKKKIDFADSKYWHLANPAMGDFLSEKDMREQAAKAQGMPSRQSSFENLRLNRRVAAFDQFLLPADWAQCEAVPAEPGGRMAWGGLDLSGTQDLTAACKLVEPEEPGQPFGVHMRFWLPEDDLLGRTKRDRVPYDAWVEAGLIHVTPGKTVDKDFVAAELFEFFADVDLQGIAYDRWRIEDLKQRLKHHGDPDELKLESWGQGFRDMAPALDELEVLLLERRLAHGGHPVLRMCAANAVATRDPAENRKLDKHKARGRIDGLQALAMAAGLRVRESSDDDQPIDFPEGSSIRTA
jgi:phage terminase large subunit-like protein